MNTRSVSDARRPELWLELADPQPGQDRRCFLAERPRRRAPRMADGRWTSAAAVMQHPLYSALPDREREFVAWLAGTAVRECVQ